MVELIVNSNSIELDKYYYDGKLLMTIQDAKTIPSIGESVEISGQLFTIFDIIHEPEILTILYFLVPKEV